MRKSRCLLTEVLRVFEKHGARVDVVLSDNGREFCGRPDRHPYDLFLQLEDIVSSPRVRTSHK